MPCHLPLPAGNGLVWWPSNPTWGYPWRLRVLHLPIAMFPEHLWGWRDCRQGRMLQEINSAQWNLVRGQGAQPLGKILSFPLWDVNGLLALLEEGDSAEIEFLGIHTFFPHCVMFSTLSFAVLYSVIRKQYPAHFFFFSLFQFSPRWDGCGCSHWGQCFIP